MTSPSDVGTTIVRGVSIYESDWQVVQEFAAMLAQETGERASVSAALRRIIREWKAAHPETVAA